MKEKSPVTLMAEAIHAHDPSLTRREAGELAASIGDRPIRVGDDILGMIGTRKYYVPWKVLFTEDEEDQEQGKS
jgi:hypothetical protein